MYETVTAGADHTVVELVDALVGTTLDGQYRIDARLAAGGFGVIYRAMHLASGRPVALKILHANLVGAPNVVARFYREGATLASLRSPHTLAASVVTETADGTLYIVMELLHGSSLFEILRSGPLEWRRAVKIARGITASLIEAHALGIVHRDLKPDNVHLEPVAGDPDHVKVLDFGIAKIVEGHLLASAPLTQEGTWIGTLDYMSPEQIMTGECDARSDLYSLGIVLYEMIAGRRPFADATTPTQILTALTSQTPARLSTHVAIPEALDRITTRLLQRDIRGRFASAAELAVALAAVESGIEPSSDDELTRTIDLPEKKTVDGLRRRFARGSTQAMTPASSDSPDSPEYEPTVLLAAMDETKLEPPLPASWVAADSQAMLATAIEPSLLETAMEQNHHQVYPPSAASSWPPPPIQPYVVQPYPVYAPMAFQQPIYPQQAPQPIAYPQQVQYSQSQYPQAGQYAQYAPTPATRPVTQNKPTYEMPDAARDVMARRIVWVVLLLIGAIILLQFR